MSKEYRPCMTGKLKSIPKGVSKEERKLSFCVSAKLCAGRATTEAEARAMCSGPKAERPKKSAPAEELPSFEEIDEAGVEFDTSSELIGEEN